MAVAIRYLENLAKLEDIYIYDSNIKDESEIKELSWFDYEYFCYDVYSCGICKMEGDKLKFEFSFEIVKRGITFKIMGNVDRRGNYSVTHFDFDSNSPNKASLTINTASLLSFDITATISKRFCQKKKHWYFRSRANHIFPEVIQS